MRWVLAVMGGLVAAGVAYLLVWGTYPDDLALIVSGAAIVVGCVWLTLAWEG